MRSTQKHLQRITIENPTDRSNIAQNTNNTNYRRSTPLHQRAQDHANRATPQHYSHKYSNKHTNNSGSTTPLQIQLKTLQTKTNLKIRALRKAEETNKQQSSDITKLQADLVEVEVKIARILRQKQKQDASNLSLNTQELQTLREQEHDLAALKTQHEQLEQAYNEQLAIGNQNRREIASFGQKLKFKKNQNSRIIFLVKALEDRRAHDLQLGNLRGQILRMLERFDQERVLSEPEIETLVLKQEEIKLVALEGLKRVMQFVEFKKLRWAFDAILGRNLISFEKSVRFKEAFVLLAAFERARKMSFFTKFILDQEGQDGVVGEVKRTSGYLLWRDLYQKRKLVYRNRVEGLKMVKKVISRKNFSQKIQFFTKLGNWLDFGRQAKLEMSNLLQRIKLKRSEGFLKLIQRRDLVETKIGLTERLISGTRERNLRLCFLRLKLWVGIDLENDLIAKSRSFELLRSNRLKTIKNQIDGFLGRSQAQEELRNQLRGVFSELKKFSQNRKIEGLEESIKGQKEEILGLDKVRFKADYRIEGYYFGFASQLKFLFLKKKGFWLLGLQIRSLGRGIGLRVAFSKLRAGRVVFGKVRNSFGKLMILGKEGRMRDVEELEVGLLGEISNQEQLIDHLEADNVVLEKNLKNSKIAKLCRNLMYYVKDIAFEVFIERTELVRRKRGLILTIFQKIEFSVKERFRANLSRLRHQTDLLALLETRKRGSRQRIRLFILQKKFEKMKKFIQTKRQKTAFLSTISSNHYKKLRFSAFHTFKSEVQKIQNNQFSAQISSQSARSADLTLATQAKSIKLITLQKTEKSQKSKFQDFLLKKLFNRLITAQFCKLSASYTHLTSFCSRMGLFKLFLQTVKKVKKSRLQRPFLTLKAHALCKKEVQMSQNLKKMRIKKDELLEDQNQLAEQIEAFGAQRRFFDSYTAFEIKKLSQIQSKITKKGAEAPIQEKYLRGLLSRFLGVWKARLLQKRAMRRIMKLRDRPVDLKEALIIWKSRVRKDKLNALIMHKIGSVLHAGQVRHRKWGFGVLKHFELISEFENTKKRILGYTRLERRDRALMEGERFLNVELILARLTFSKKSENMKFLFEVLGNEGFEKRMVGGAQAVFMRRRRERVWKAFFGVLKDMRFLTKRVDFIRSKRAMGRKVYLLRLLQFNLWARRAEKLKLANFLKSAESPFFRAKTEIWGHLRAKVDLCYASEPKLRSTVSIFSRKVENLIFENRVKNLSKGLRTIATYKRKEYRALLSCLNRIFSRKAKMVVRSLQRYSEYKRHIINDSVSFTASKEPTNTHLDLKQLHLSVIRLKNSNFSQFQFFHFF